MYWRKIIKSSLFLFPFFLFAQVNLVPNGNFESGNSGATPGCYSYYSPGGSCGGYATGIACANRFDDDVANWNVGHRKITINPFYRYGSPDWVDANDCAAQCFVGSTATHNNLSRYVHMSSETENIRVGLQRNGTSYKLIPNKKYIFKIRIQPIYKGKIRIFFTEWGKHWNSNSSNNEKWEAINANVHFDGSNSSCDWEFITREFTAPANLTNLGNLILVMGDDDGATYTRLSVDDVQLYENNTCPEDRYMQNKIHWSETNLYQAKRDIIAGNNVITPSSQFTPVGDVIVKYNSKIIYRAGNQVDLRPGFQTEGGSYFEAYIHPCEEDPCPKVTERNKEIIVCGTNPVSIGFADNEDSELFHKWTPSSYLDNPLIANPTFTAPQGIGKVEYTNTMSSVCGYFRTGGFPTPFKTSLENKVTVYYDSNPSDTASLTINNLNISDYFFTYDVSVDNHSEWIKVEILDSNSNAVLHERTFIRNKDFTCCNFTSTYSNSLLTKCKDYKIRFSSKNYCFETIASETKTWDINNTLAFTLLPNVFSPNGDGINDNWCVEVTGADTYELTIKNRWGNTKKSSSGSVTNNRICLWDGTKQNGNEVSDGVYYYVLKIKACGKEITRTGSITKF